MDLNPVLTPVRDLGEFIREQRTAAQISVRALAAKAGVSNPYLSQVERGLRRPSAEILAQIAHGLSISVETLLAKAGILETAEAPTVVIAIRADEVLTERQKSALVDIYAAFRKEAEAAAAALAPPVTDALAAVAESAVAESAVAESAVAESAVVAGTVATTASTLPTAPPPTAPPLAAVAEPVGFPERAAATPPALTGSTPGAATPDHHHH